MSETTKTDLVPFVSVKLGCQVQWVDARIADGIETLVVGVRQRCRERVDNTGSNSSDATRNLPCRDEVFYKVTPAVHAWIREKLSAIEDEAYSVASPQSRDEWAALSVPDRQQVRESLAVAAGRWFVVDDWARVTYGADALHAAKPGLPRPEKLPAACGHSAASSLTSEMLKRKGIVR